MMTLITISSVFNGVFLLFVLVYHISSINAYFDSLILEKLFPNQRFILQMNSLPFFHVRMIISVLSLPKELVAFEFFKVIIDELQYRCNFG